MNRALQKINLAKIHLWFEKANSTQRYLALFILLLTTWMLWKAFFLGPLETAVENRSDEITTAQQKITTLAALAENIEKNARDANWVQHMGEDQRMDKSLQQSTREIAAIVNKAVSIKQLPQLTADLLSAQQGITVNAVRNLPSDLWIATPPEGVILPPNVKRIQKYSIEINFHGRYLETVQYLTRVSALHWRIAWDTLHYQVAKWPDADIQVSFHVLGQRDNAGTT